MRGFPRGALTAAAVCAAAGCQPAKRAPPVVTAAPLPAAPPLVLAPDPAQVARESSTAFELLLQLARMFATLIFTRLSAYRMAVGDPEWVPLQLLHILRRFYRDTR